MKSYKIKYERKGHERIIEGTLPELIKYFGYTLEIGASWNRTINRNPKTIKSFITNLKKSYNEKEAACYERTYIELIG